MASMDASEFNFERFVEVGQSFDPRVTIRENGQIGFTAGAQNCYGVRDHKCAVLFYDAEKKCVGMLLTNDENERGAMPVRSRRENTYIPAKPFLQKHAISFSESRRFRLEKHGDFLVFDLGKQVESASAQKKAAPSD